MLKRECAKCGEKVRWKNSLRYKPTGEWRCKKCIRKYGQNKFYLLPEERNKFNPHGLNLDERQALFGILVQKGLSSAQANYRIKNRQKYLNWFGRNKMVTKIKEEYGKRKELFKSKVSKEKFLKGLGMKK